MRDPDLPKLEELFPNLTGDNYEVTSEAVSRYNCVAWAVGSSHHWWEAIRMRGFYWPPGIPFNDLLSTWTSLFELHGFQVCENERPEPGWEKIAIYVDSEGTPQHVARQLPSGEWTSKLGELEDIRHKTLTALESEDYGNATTFLKKQRPDWVNKA